MALAQIKQSVSTDITNAGAALGTGNVGQAATDVVAATLTWTGGGISLSSSDLAEIPEFIGADLSLLGNDLAEGM
jgi:hypothetical protein